MNVLNSMIANLIKQPAFRAQIDAVVLAQVHQALDRLAAQLDHPAPVTIAPAPAVARTRAKK